MSELDYKEGWALKNWCFWTVVLEKTLESPLDSKEIKPVSTKGNQPWIFTGRTDGEAPILWPPDAKSWLIRKDPEAEKDWRQKEKRVAEDEMSRWHYWPNWHESEQTLRDSEAWHTTVPGVTKSWARLSDWTTTIGRLPRAARKEAHILFTAQELKETISTVSHVCLPCVTDLPLILPVWPGGRTPVVSRAWVWHQLLGLSRGIKSIFKEPYSWARIIMRGEVLAHQRDGCCIKHRLMCP